MELGRATSDTIKFLDGQLQRTILLGMTAKQRSKPANGKNRLHGSFAERVLVTDNYGAPVILESSRKDFAGGRALPASQHHQWPRICDCRIGIGRDPNASIIIFRLDDRA